MLNSVTTLDTISLYRDFDNLSEIIINQSIFNNCFNLKNNNKENTFKNDDLRLNTLILICCITMICKSLCKVLLKVEFTPDFHQKLLVP